MQAELVTARNKVESVGTDRHRPAALTEGDGCITHAHMAETAQSNNSWEAEEEMKAGVLSLSQSLPLCVCCTRTAEADVSDTFAPFK